MEQLVAGVTAAWQARARLTVRSGNTIHAPMAFHSRLGAAAVGALLVSAPAWRAHAQEQAQPSDEAANEVQARQVLLAFSLQERSERLHGGYGLLISGAAAAGAGLLADLHYEKSYGQPVWIAGAVLGLSGLLSFTQAGPLESFATESTRFRGVALQRHWATLAQRAARARHIAGGINLGVGLLAAGAGGAIAAGVGGLKPDARENWTVALILGGGALASTGVVTLLVESKSELGYRAAYGEAPAEFASLQLGGGLVPGGGALSVSGSF